MPFKGPPDLALHVASGTSERQGPHQVWRAMGGGPRNPLKTKANPDRSEKNDH